MPDITMCQAEPNVCRQCTSCYRKLAKPGQRQSYFVGVPRHEDYCEYYWPCAEVEMTLDGVWVEVGRDH